jgi:hypothetical protein
VPRLGAQPKIIEGKDGPLQTDGVNGLVWTDLILGKIDDKSRATQKAGRGAGIIGHSPQWPGEIHYWMHAETAKLVRAHNETVDQVNKLQGSNSALQATTRATAIVTAQGPVIPAKNHEVDPNMFRVFRDEASTRGFCQAMGYMFRKPPLTRSGPDESFCKTSLKCKARVVHFLDVIKKLPTLSNGDGELRTVLPCYTSITDPTTLRYLVVVEWNQDKTVKDPARLAQADARFPSIPVPQTGSLESV